VAIPLAYFRAAIRERNDAIAQRLSDADLKRILVECIERAPAVSLTELTDCVVRDAVEECHNAEEAK
jgi:hypothetical protein